MIVVPVYNIILAPDANTYFGMDQIRRSAGDKGMTVGEKVVLVVAKRNENYSEMTPESFYPVGMAGTITEINNKGYVLIHTQYRVNIENIEISPDRTIQLSISRRNDIEDMSAAVEKEKLDDLLDEMRKFSAGFDWGEAVEYWIRQIDTIGKAASAMSPWLEITNEEIRNTR